MIEAWYGSMAWFVALYLAVRWGRRVPQAEAIGSDVEWLHSVPVRQPDRGEVLPYIQRMAALKRYITIDELLRSHP